MAWVLFILIGLAGWTNPASSAQSPPQQSSNGVMIHGVVLDASGMGAPDASVRLERTGTSNVVEIKTGKAGAFTLSAPATGSYTLSAEKSGMHSRAIAILLSAEEKPNPVQLVIDQKGSDEKGSLAEKPAALSQVSAMQFADEPNFTVAGVTDWTAVGGHGSDLSLRTSEALNRETLTLKPQGENAPVSATPGSADALRLAGELAEKSGDPLAAVKEFEQAVRLDPSEQNYFEWGSELLLHRAVWQAQEVFQNGAKAYPQSARMLTALGAAFFAGARYEEAATQLCASSDLNPADAEPYTFMGKIAIAAPASLPCIEQRLARFAKQQPENQLANYFYAMAILKRLQQSPDPGASEQAEALLKKAVSIDSKCSDGFLQLGILSFSQRKYDAAIGFYTKAIAADPKSGEAHYRLGVAYDRIGQSARAAQEFQLHDQIEKQQAAAIEEQRREIKQFRVAVSEKSASPESH